MASGSDRRGHDLTHEEWEALCDGCGGCCDMDNTGYACPGLDCETKRCTVYETRHKMYPCLKVTPDNVFDLHQRGILPSTCGYVRHMCGQEPLTEVPEYILVPYAKAPLRIQKIVNEIVEKHRRDQ